MYENKSNTIVPVFPRNPPQAMCAPLKPPVGLRTLTRKRREPSSSNSKFATPPAETVAMGMAWLPLRIARRSAVEGTNDVRSVWRLIPAHKPNKIETFDHNISIQLPLLQPSLGVSTSCKEIDRTQNFHTLRDARSGWVFLLFLFWERKEVRRRREWKRKDGPVVYPANAFHSRLWGD